MQLQTPLPDAPLDKLPFHWRSSISAGPDFYSSGTDPAIVRQRKNHVPLFDQEINIRTQQMLAKHIQQDREEKQ